MPYGDDQIKIFYNLTVCGITSSGDYLMKRK